MRGNSMCFVVLGSVVWGVLWIVLQERSIGFAVGEWGMLNWTLGVRKFLFHLGWIICLFISSVCWFWLWCLALIKSCWRGRYTLYTSSFCGLLRDAWRITSSSRSNNRACLSSNFLDCLEKRCALMIGGYLFDNLLVLMEVLGMLLVGTDVGLLISNFGKIWKIIYLWRNFVYFVRLFD